MVDNIISVVQIAIAVFLVVAVLLQQRGSGLSSAFGGGGGVYYQKRGMDKFLLYATVGLAFLFMGIALLRLFL